MQEPNPKSAKRAKPASTHEVQQAKAIEYLVRPTTLAVVEDALANTDRSDNSWTGVLNIGAPVHSGDWIIEPQALLSYTNTSLDKFSEHGEDKRNRLRFHEMEVDQVGSELSLKFAHPIRSGDRSLFLPSLRVGWATDWGVSGDHQKVSYLDFGKG